MIDPQYLKWGIIVVAAPVILYAATRAKDVRDDPKAKRALLIYAFISTSIFIAWSVFMSAAK